MSWSKGVFRIWAVLSVLWLLGIGISAYERVWMPNSELHQANEAKKATQDFCFKDSASNKSKNPFDCFDTGYVPDNTFVSYRPYITMAVGGPLSILGAWFAGLWIIAGFRQRSV
jgi:hypothetical protein